MKNSEIDFDKILNEVISSNPEFSREILNEGLEASIAGIILRLFLKHEIDESRINDLEYVWSLVIENLDLLEEIPLIRQRFDDEFLESAKEAAKQGRVSVAIVLVATVIEHHLNVFYRDILEDYSGLSTNEATEAIRSNVSTKLGWLFHAITHDQMSEELVRQIKQVFELRNAFVHFKSIMVPLGKIDKAEELLTKVSEIGLENILELPEKVADELTEKAAKLMPAYQKAYQIAEALMNMQPKKQKE